ncbi:hypothetical protein [Aliarcobacter cryaerophilus]|uniref:Uncharacterized protein n=1 Tax=Aliarcobacter cryaerophilus TaxID=28198 RepID=A0A5C0E3T5_9BACT|nr:hypothetical protein [Aliarcobacter cryaerophilus]QEI46257.1 hypothetical protein pM830MA_0070 [Aliarcobacter cryaerophilus]
MIKIVKIIVVALTTIYLFSGCSGKLPPKNFSLHKETVRDIKQKDINIQVSNVKLTGDALNNKYMYFVLIDEEEIKTHLLTNINKFYINNPLNQKFYKIDIDMDFKRELKKEGISTTINATYNVSDTNQVIKPINIVSTYVAEDTATFGKIMGAAMIQVFTGVPYIGEQNNTHLKYDSLEKTAYAEDDTVVLTAYDANIRLNTSYTGAIRLNFAKFLQKFNELLNNESQILAIKN